MDGASTLMTPAALQDHHLEGEDSTIHTRVIQHSAPLSGPTWGGPILGADGSILSPVVKSPQHPSQQVWPSWKERSRTACVWLSWVRGPGKKGDGTPQQDL